MTIQANIINPILNNMCDQPAGAGGQVGNLLRQYAGYPGAANFYGGALWWNEATVQETFYRYIQALGVANYLVLAEHRYPNDPDGRRSDITVVDTGGPELLGIEIKASFDISHTEDDISKLSDLHHDGKIARGVALFVAASQDFDRWHERLVDYSDRNTAGFVDVGGIRT